MATTSRISLLLALLLCTQVRPGLALEPTPDGKKELQRLKQEMQEKKKELKRADRKERSILTELDRMDREVQAGKAELAEQHKALREAEASLRHVEQSNGELSRELSGLKQLYGHRLRALYKMSKNGYAAGALAAGPGDAAKRKRYLSIIAERDQALIQDFGKALISLSQQQADMTEKKHHLLERRQSIEAKKNTLVSRKKKKALILASVREQKNVYEHTLRELEESSASLWAMVKRSERERPSEPKQSPPRQPAATGVDANRLPWPLEGRVLTRFGMQRHPQFRTMVFRRGIEISAREGDAVHAVSDGKVAFADWYKGYGRLMIVEHGPGFYTLYGNLSRLDLNKGDRVAKGQVLGLAGDTGSLKGSKLYFEMRRNGEAQDPLLWLARR
jgi:septal ring factor EnvC (AmiA/AmiB activator)